MSDTANWLVHDHRKYDAALQACEFAAGAEDWKEAARIFYDLVEELKLHMRMEDEVLYPFFVKEHGDSQGEIAALSSEHDTIVRLLKDLAAVIKNRDFDHFEESLKPLYEALTEHNEHEEQVFSRLSGHALLARREEVERRLATLMPQDIKRVWDF